jgi:hypothetical protein
MPIDGMALGITEQEFLNWGLLLKLDGERTYPGTNGK